MIVSTMKSAFRGLGDPTPTVPADPSAPATVDPSAAANAAADAANSAAQSVGLPADLNWKTILGGAAVGWWVWGIKGAALGAGAGWYVGRGSTAPALPALPGSSGTTVAADGSTVAAPSSDGSSAGGDSMSTDGGVTGPTASSNPFGPTGTDDASGGVTTPPDLTGAVPIAYRRGRSSGGTILAPPKNSVVITPAMLQKKVAVASGHTALAASTRPSLVPVTHQPTLSLKGYGAAPGGSGIAWGTVLSGIFAGAFVAGKPGALMGGVAALAPSLLGSLK